ncbi:MAG: DEAD/DEAH box helicase [Desulfuromonadales bacterium]|nr:MAG: DEAD/DEAH box helicase [Desulfuromonadales bacterium]
MAGKVDVLQGLALGIAKKVKEISWNGDRSILHAKVEDGRYYEVSIRREGGGLACSCDCDRWRPTTHCPHVVCALAVLRKAVDPVSFASYKLDGAYLDEVAQWLGIGAGGPATTVLKPDRAPAVPAFRLVLERGAEGPRMQVWKEARPVNHYDSNLPRTMKDFLWALLISREGGKIVERFHDTFGETYPIVFRRQGKETPLRFDRGTTRGTRTLLARDEGWVTIHKALEDGNPLPTDAFATYRYFVDVPNGVIQIIDRFEGWEPWTEINGLVTEWSVESGIRVQRDMRTITLETGLFNGLAVAVPDQYRHDFLACARFTVAGADVVPAESTPAYRIRVAEVDDLHALILAEGVHDGTPFGLSPSAFGLFTSEGRSALSVSMKTKKRGAVLVAACFDSLRCGTKAEFERMTRAAFSGDDFLKRAVKIEAKRLVNGFHLSCASTEHILMTDAGGWTFVNVDKREQARLLEIPYRLFGPEIFADSPRPGALRLPRAELFRSLSELHGKLREAGFDLVFQGKPLESVSLDVTIDATSSTLDWFELKPEVRCGAELLTDREIAEAMASGGVFQRGDSFLILDEESSRLLAMLCPGAGGKKRKKAELVRIPRLQILDWLLLRSQGVTVRLSPEDERIFASLASFENIPKETPPAGLRSPLRHYQEDGFSWLAFLYGHRFGACLADDMGLGKTIQAISLLAGLHEGAIPSRGGERPHLIVVPPSLLFNWESELNRFYPELTVHTYRGSGRSTDFGGARIVLTSYGIVQRDIDMLREIPFHVMVFDEAQAVKNIQAATTGACRQLRGEFTLLLTGTPVENHLGEYYSVMDLAVPGLLGTHEEFHRRMGADDNAFLSTVIRRTRPFVLRRSKQMIAAELPPKIETDIHLELTPKQKALYTRTVEEVRQTVEDAWRSQSPGQARIITLTAILRLRQLCLSPRLLVPEAREASPKIEFLVEQLQELFDEGHSVLVFSQFTSFLDIVQKALVHHGLPHLRLDGSTPVPERKKLVTTFQKGEEPSAFLLSLKAGGRGLNLTRATYVFHLDPWWNPAVENQASDRAHRIGQTRQVTITRLIMRHTIEEKMMELKKRKLKLYQALLEDAAGEGSAGLSREDFEFLLG